jgi:hypothetical protein
LQGIFGIAYHHSVGMKTYAMFRLVHLNLMQFFNYLFSSVCKEAGFAFIVHKSKKAKKALKRYIPF